MWGGTAPRKIGQPPQTLYLSKQAYITFLSLG